MQSQDFPVDSLILQYDLSNVDENLDVGRQEFCYTFVPRRPTFGAYRLLIDFVADADR